MSNYAGNWDNYYRKTYILNKGKSLWEVGASESVEQDRLRFQEYFSTDLPIIDIGCGTGEQAVYLRKFYDRVIGLDVSREAITIALNRHEKSGVQFSDFDIADSESARKLSATYGPCNLYMRGILHQTLKEDRPQILNTIKILLGNKGSMYIIEVGDNIRDYLSHQVSSFSELPESIKLALKSNLPPIGLSVEKLPEWFPDSDFKITCSGNAFLATNLLLPDKSRLEIPAVFAMVSVKK